MFVHHEEEALLFLIFLQSREQISLHAASRPGSTLKCPPTYLLKYGLIGTVITCWGSPATAFSTHLLQRVWGFDWFASFSQWFVVFCLLYGGSTQRTSVLQTNNPWATPPPHRDLLTPWPGGGSEGNSDCDSFEPSWAAREGRDSRTDGWLKEVKGRGDPTQWGLD